MRVSLLVAVLEAIPQVLVVVLLVLAEAEIVLLLGECGEGEGGDDERSQDHERPHSAYPPCWSLFGASHQLIRYSHRGPPCTILRKSNFEQPKV